MVKTRNIKTHWFALGILAVLLAAPNAAIIKVSVGSVDPFFFIAIRFLLVACVLTPFILKYKKRFTALNLKYAAISGMCMSFAVVSFVWAIKLSEANYVSIITLITPLLLVAFSAKLNREKMNNKALTGIALASLGAMCIVILPIALSQGAVVFHPLATVLALVNCVTFPLGVIAFKKANEQQLPMLAILSLSSWQVGIISGVLYILVGVPVESISSSALIGILYAVIGVSIAAHLLRAECYEHIGSTVTAALSYLETFIAILIPVFFLGEKISIVTVFGGILILLGVYVSEHHKLPHHKHHVMMPNH